MAWFNQNKVPHGPTETSHDERVEVVVAKEANKEVVELAKEANSNLARLLKENHFTIKIFIATGGKIKPKVVKVDGH